MSKPRTLTELNESVKHLIKSKKRSTKAWDAESVRLLDQLLELRTPKSILSKVYRLTQSATKARVRNRINKL
jgi:hypothetical protein